MRVFLFLRLPYMLLQHGSPLHNMSLYFRLDHFHRRIYNPASVGVFESVGTTSLLLVCCGQRGICEKAVFLDMSRTAGLPVGIRRA